MSATITIDHLSVHSRLLPLSFQVQCGEVIHIIGPNGSGKSTLLSAMAGVLKHQGHVCIDGLQVNKASLAELALKRAYLSQNERPAFHIEVFQYLALSLPATCDLHQIEVTKTIEYLTSLVAVNDKLHRSIYQLSGGEWQRVRLVAISLQVWPSLNPHARLLLLDEPAAPLDIGQETLLHQLIRTIAQQGIGVVMANHDLNRTLRYADRVLLLDHGVLQAEGSVRELLTPTHLSALFKTAVRRVEVDGEACLFFD